MAVYVAKPAAIAGDTVNYWIGAIIGPRAFSGNIRFLKKEHLERTHRFYEKYGGKTIIIARFVPIVRTFAPFVAGIGAMNYARFIVYNIIGGVAWVALFVFGGYWFADTEFFKSNFSLVVVAIIVISVMPMVDRVSSRAAPGGVRPLAALGSRNVPLLGTSSARLSGDRLALLSAKQSHTMADFLAWREP